FLNGGAIQAAMTDNRVALSTLLAENPGRAVKDEVNKALDAGNATALYEFITTSFEKAQREDDGVATSTLLVTGGPYTKAYAQVAMEGPASLRRNFIHSVQYKSAQLDHDSATHIAAMQGAIAAAAKIAHKAQEDAHRAQEAAAYARNASTAAKEWADKAQVSAASALVSANEANTLANQADQSAQNAKASADKAKQAAAVATTAARSANYSANRAIASARSAVASATAAQASAASARSSAVQAGKDAATAAIAASSARQIAVSMRQTEVALEAKKAAEAAQASVQSGTNQADAPEHDTVKDASEWWKTAKGWAAKSHEAAIFTGWVTVGLGLTGLAAGAFGVTAPAVPFIAGLALSAGQVTIGLEVISTVSTGIGYGWTSSEFKRSLGITTISALTFGVGRIVHHSVGSHLVKEISGIGREAVSTIVSWLGAGH
ncbi:hypothetical protein ACIQV3_40105, partial [Streptomyces sp. NPDC099050]